MERTAIGKGLLPGLVVVSAMALVVSGAVGSDWQHAGRVGRAGATDTVYFWEDFESYSSVADPAFQAAWTVGSVYGTGAAALVPHETGQALSLSHPVHDHATATSSGSFPFRRVVEGEVMNTDFGSGSPPSLWYGACLIAYLCEEGYVSMYYCPAGQNFIVLYRIDGTYPYGDYYSCGSNIAISSGQWYKMKIEMDEEHLRYYYDVGTGYQLLCELDHDYSLLDGGIRLAQQGWDAADGVFDNVTVSALAGWHEGDDHKMHYPQTPKSGGWDVEFAWSRLADDWMCAESGPVTDIHFWISWMQDQVQPIGGVAVRIWSNNPMGPYGYSIPDQLLWEREFEAFELEVIEWPPDLQGWFMPPDGGYFLDDHTRRFQVNIEDIQDPFYQCEGTIYWLELDFGPLNFIGWKETDQNWNDAAVIWAMAKWWEIIDPVDATPIDLAFVITGPTGLGRTINNTVDLSPFYDWGAISSYAGLVPSGFMGIYSPTHTTYYYFPSDSLSPAPSNTPKAWLTPGTHLATSYGPGASSIPSNPIVTTFDRNNNRCTLLVEIPSEEFIDEAGDLNVIQISPGEQTMLLPIDDTAETVVFLANCDGWVYAPGVPSSDQPLRVILDYNGGTQDSVVVDNIHPGERANNIYTAANFVFCNEVFGCGPPYYDLPTPGHDHNHSEFWHWYAVYPDTTKLLDAIIFEGLQTADTAIYILAISYSGPCCNGDGMRGNADDQLDGGFEVTVTDLTYLVAYLFGGGPPPPCEDEGNVDGLYESGFPITVSDLTYLVSYLFEGGPAPAACP